MAYEDFYRLSVHAALFDEQNRVLLVKTTYGAKSWTLPGGAMDPGETIHETLLRECREELGCDIEAVYLSGVYFHQAHQSQAFVFRCRFTIPGQSIVLSAEHSQHRYFPLEELSESHRVKVTDCLRFKGAVFSQKF